LLFGSDFKLGLSGREPGSPLQSSGERKGSKVTLRGAGYFKNLVC